MSRNVPAPTEVSAASNWHDGLTAKERRFIEEYLVDLNARQAALRCGMGRGNVKSATEVGSRLKRKLAANISAALAEKSGITATALINELGAVAYARVTDFMIVENGRVVVKDTALWTDEQKAAVSEIWETTDGDGYRVIRIKLHDKLGAIDKLGKSIGLFKEADVNHRHKHEHEFVDPMARIKERLNALRRSLAELPDAEIDPPPRRIAPPQPERTASIIDGQAE
jgi:phage terminase small subunit